MIQEGIVLTISGMAFVFLFLLLLVWIILLTSLVISKLGGKIQTEPALSGGPEELETALALAVSYHRNKTRTRR